MRFTSHRAISLAILSFATLASMLPVSAAPEACWSHTYGTPQHDALGLTKRSTGRLFVYGTIAMTDAPPGFPNTPPNQQGDPWIARVNDSGHISLDGQTAFTGARKDWSSGFSPVMRNDPVLGEVPDGFALGAVTASYGNEAFWLIRLDEDLDTIRWQRVYQRYYYTHMTSMDTSDDDAFYPVSTHPTRSPGPGYIMAGSTAGASRGRTGGADAWIMKADVDGWPDHIIPEGSEPFEPHHWAWWEEGDPYNGDNINVPNGWQRAYGGMGTEYVTYVEATDDGGFIFSAYTDSVPGQGFDFWVVKIDRDGTLVWQATYGIPGTAGTAVGRDSAYWIEDVDADPPYFPAGYVVTGFTSGEGGGGAWVLRLDLQGNVLWQRAYGHPASDQLAQSIEGTADRGYILAGYSRTPQSDTDGWLVKLDRFGDVEWASSYGGQGDDELRHARAVDDGYVAAGYRTVVGGTLEGWLMKVRLDGSVPPGSTLRVNPWPQGFNGVPVPPASVVVKNSAQLSPHLIAVAPEDTIPTLIGEAGLRSTDALSYPAPSVTLTDSTC